VNDLNIVFMKNTDLDISLLQKYICVIQIIYLLLLINGECKSAKTFILLVPFHFDLSKGVIRFKVENFAV